METGVPRRTKSPCFTDQPFGLCIFSGASYAAFNEVEARAVSWNVQGIFFQPGNAISATRQVLTEGSLLWEQVEITVVPGRDFANY